MTGGDTTANRRDSAVTCQHRAGAASDVSAHAGASRARDIPPAPVSQPWPSDGSGKGRTPANGHGNPTALPGGFGGSPAPQMCSLPAQEACGDECLFPLPTHLEPSPTAAPRPPPRAGAAPATAAPCHARRCRAEAPVPSLSACPEAVPNLFPFPVSVSPCRGGNGGKSSKKRCSCTSCRSEHREPPGPSPQQHGRAPQSWGLQPMSRGGGTGAGSFTRRQIHVQAEQSLPGICMGTVLEDTRALHGCPAHTRVRGKEGIHLCPPARIVGVLGSLGSPKPHQCPASTGCRSRVSSAVRGEARPDKTPRGAGGDLSPSVCCHRLPGWADPTHLPRQDPRQGLGSLGTKAAISHPPGEIYCQNLVC